MQRTLRFGVVCGIIAFGAHISAQSPPGPTSDPPGLIRVKPRPGDPPRQSPTPSISVRKESAELEASGIGRYQLVAGEFTGPSGTDSKKAVFKIDSKTGATWTFYSEPTDSSGSGTWKPIGK